MTNEFLNYINHRRFGRILKTHLDHGGLIIGVSAGTIVFTPNIAVATLPFADPNDIGLKDLTALNFVNFEFSPHFTPADLPQYAPTPPKPPTQSTLAMTKAAFSLTKLPIFMGKLLKYTSER